MIMVFLYVLLGIVAIAFYIWVANQFGNVAELKGYGERKWTVIVICIFFPLAGYLLTCALPNKNTDNTDRKSENTTADYKNQIVYGRQGKQYSYCKKCKGGNYTYYAYCVINLDEGCVYRFADDEDVDFECGKIKSGTLNDCLIVAYDDGSKCGIHFKYKNRPDCLVIREQDGAETEYYSTDLKETLTELKKYHK